MIEHSLDPAEPFRMPRGIELERMHARAMVCPKCGSKNTGTPTLRHGLNRYCCYDCNHQWKYRGGLKVVTK